MRFSILLYILYWILKRASKRKPAFIRYISPFKAKILIKTAKGRRGRMLIFDKGKVTSRAGNHHKDFDVAMVWKDSSTGFNVMIKQSDEAQFYAAAQGKLMIEGIPYYAQWFREAVNLAM